MNVEAEGTISDLTANGQGSDFSDCRFSLEVPQEVFEALAETAKRLDDKEENSIFDTVTEEVA